MSREEIYSIPDVGDFARAIIEDERAEEQAQLKEDYRAAIQAEK